MTDETKDEVKDLEIIFPQGRVIELMDDVTVRVMPMGFIHIRRFSDDLARVAAAIMDAVEIDPTKSETEIGAYIAAQAIPLLMGNCVEMISACLVFEKGGELAHADLNRLPHYYAPPIIEAWLDESFGSEEKRSPWVRAINQVIARVTGNEKFQISGTLSKLWSSLATKLPTSSE